MNSNRCSELPSTAVVPNKEMRVVQAGICALVTYSVLAFGAVNALSEFILEIGAVALLLVWFLGAVRRDKVIIRANWLYLPFFGFCGVALIQYALALTAYPYSTKVELLKLGIYLFLSFLVVESVPTAREQNKFAWLFAILAFTVSLFGILQYFTWNGKFYWIKEVANSGTSFGPFVDRDHFGGFVELTVPFAFAMLLSGAVRRDLLALVSFFGIVPVGALALAGSRGGILSVFFEMSVLLILLRGQILPSGKRLPVIVFLVLSGVFVAWLGIDGTLQRFKETAASGVTEDRRLSMYKNTWRIFMDHRWMGTGLGTLQSVYPRYESYYDGYIVDHAHNDYLELLADTGIAGGFCGIAFLVLLFKQGSANLRAATTRFASAFYSGALAACAGFLFHSAVDFNLHIPSNALLFFLIAFAASSSIPGPKGENRAVAHAHQS